MKQFIKYILFFSLLISVKSYGSHTNTYAYYDSLTYDLYTHQQWKKLTVAGKEALSNGFDYYYLRVRLGIACYHLQNYRQSITHFRKALQFNSSDSFALEYLYYDLIETGQKEEAILLASQNPSALSAIAGSGKNPFEFFFAEGGYTPDAISGHRPQELMGNDSIYGEEDTYAGESYFHAGTSLHILPSLSCYLGYSNLGIDKEKHFSGSTVVNHLDSINKTIYSLNYFYSFPGKLFDTLIPYNVKQNEFYITTSWIPRPGYSITPAFHYINGITQTYTSEYQLLPRADTSYLLASDNKWYFINDTVSRYKIGQQVNKYSNYVISLAASKEWRNFSFGINVTYASLTTYGKQKQLGLNATWFPFGNLNLYATTSLTGFFYKKDKRLIFDQLVGGRIAPKLWLEGLFTLGNLSLYNEKNAFIAYNLADRIKLRTGANLIITLGRHIDLSLMYRFYTKEYDYLYYRKPPVGSPPGSIPITNTIKYNNQSIIGGIKWKL
ncbi:MAG: tetratricopeptide repeat protein [Bacteroidales bacterium]